MSNRLEYPNSSPNMQRRTNSRPMPQAQRQPVPQKRKKSGRKKENNRHFKMLLVLFFSLIVLDLVLVGIYLWDQYDKIIKNVEIEAGDTVNLDMFMESDFVFRDKVECNVPFEIIDTKVPQHINFNLKIGIFKVPCVLDIKDTVAPIAEAIPQTFYLNQAKLPEAKDIVKNVYDLSGEVTIEYYGEPTIKAGKFSNFVSLTDKNGNMSVLEVPFVVTDDHVAPVISGAKNITYWVGDTISYRDGVTVTDDCDSNPKLEIDNSSVDLNNIGDYPVIYIATDEAGNQSTEEIVLTVKKHPTTYVSKDVLYAEAQKLLDKITTEDMTDMQKALQIFYWCRYNINYIGSTDTTSWTRAAYDAITKKQGTCYSYANAARALLDCAGIENRILKRDPYRYSKHYWNYIKIDGEWYHCDSTPRHTYRLYLFMYTDRELENFFVDNYNGYSFNHEGVPESSKTSVQNRIDYWGHKIKD